MGFASPAGEMAVLDDQRTRKQDRCSWADRCRPLPRSHFLTLAGPGPAPALNVRIVCGGVPNGPRPSSETQVGETQLSRRSCALTAARASRCPPRRSIAASRSVSIRTTVSASGSHPRPTHSANQLAGDRWPRSALHRRQAATSFSSQLGPPLSRGIRWSVVGRINRVKSRPHQKQRRPSRSIASSSRATRPGCPDLADSMTVVYPALVRCRGGGEQTHRRGRVHAGKIDCPRRGVAVA